MRTDSTLTAAMDCRELERSIDAYLDGEFDERERAEAEAHLATCTPCRAMADRQGALRLALRAKLREAMASPAAAGCAPPHLRARVRTSLAHERRPLWRRVLQPVPVAAVAACAMGVLVVLAGHRGDTALVDDAIRVHHRALPLEVDAAAMPGWFAGKLDFHPALPHFAGAVARLEGARLSNLREWPAAYVRYQLPRGQAGLFIVDDPDRRFDTPGREVKVGPQVVRVVNARGYNVAVWRQDEIVYSLVSDLDEDALFKLVQAAQAEAAAGR
ncbi:zf-HC2 domain-containing protein [Anaeromyxobacter dehalogenans]|uniref:Putative transmembrane transcriptional regulator (Anti-sigma factor) n=1 Tax=Anaeromyxobacter dehalogenans (strain 2CP-C) TaxID=290397 RepID=Q2IKG9_ANADE|nr:zf-HC2 domain-containing protein [Anaeromyxobacter dehalogenans]ABC82149.1 putative transmembrane transcriptional regulator (anti-sigma factor) [Anaeromyxobacter dehalogenans 2CP-C]